MAPQLEVKRSGREEDEGRRTSRGADGANERVHLCLGSDLARFTGGLGHVGRVRHLRPHQQVPVLYQAPIAHKLGKKTVC